MSAKITYEEIKSFIEGENGNGCKLITTKEEYQNNNMNSSSKLKILCGKCNKQIFEKNYLHFKHKSQIQCPKCGHKNGGNSIKLSYEYVKNFIEVESKSGCKLLSTEYKNASTKIKLKCLCGNKFETTFAKFKDRNKRQCNKCGIELKKQNLSKSHEQFVKEVYNLVGDEYTILDKYKTTHIKIKIRHNKCSHEYWVMPSNFLQGKRCPTCDESKGEQRIRYWLESNNIHFKKEFIFKDLKDIKELPFDFAIFEDEEKTKLKYLIEYDGEGHYNEKAFGKKSLFFRLKHDKMKNIYCKINSIELIRIPYWEFDNIEKILSEKTKC